MSSLSDSASLLVAGLDLKLVQLLTSAIRTADLSRAPASPNTPAATTVSSDKSSTSLPVSVKGLRYSDHPAATYCPGYNAITDAAIHRRHTHRLPAVSGGGATEAVPRVDLKNPIEAPWKVLPWPERVPKFTNRAHRPVKIVPSRADVSVVGRTLDLFV